MRYYLGYSSRLRLTPCVLVFRVTMRMRKNVSRDTYVYACITRRELDSLQPSGDLRHETSRAPTLTLIVRD